MFYDITQLSKTLLYNQQKHLMRNDDVIVHCHEKLLRILPEGFIKTQYGKVLAQPLHDQIVEYV